MTTNTNTPITAARKIRDYRDALAARDVLAIETHDDAELCGIGPAGAAEIFHRRRSGTPRCEHVGLDLEPGAVDHQRYPCCEDAVLLVTNFSTSAVAGDPFRLMASPSQMTKALCATTPHSTPSPTTGGSTHHRWRPPTKRPSSSSCSSRPPVD